MGLISEDVLKHRREADWEGDAYQLTLYTLALGLNAQLIYEWGVGYSTLALLRAAERTGGQVISCDTNEERVNIVYDNIKMAQARGRWLFFPVSSEEMHQRLRAQADLIFIDGTHSFSCVLWEVENYWSLLKEDGLMVLHDTRSFAEGPGRVMGVLADIGLEVVELPFCCGMAVIHKRAGDPERLEL